MYCIIIAGMPCTGKSQFLTWLKEKRNIPAISKDNVNEILFDTVGFESREDKVKLGVAALDILYYFSRDIMRLGSPFIIENNFEDISRDSIKTLLEDNGYAPITVMFNAKLEVVHKRFIERDMSPSRHRGHVVNTSYPETEAVPYSHPLLRILFPLQKSVDSLDLILAESELKLIRQILKSLITIR